jgi:hypothetical protein
MKKVPYKSVVDLAKIYLGMTTRHDLATSTKVEASISVKISSCSYLETRFPPTKSIYRK